MWHFSLSAPQLDQIQILSPYPEDSLSQRRMHIAQISIQPDASQGIRELCVLVAMWNILSSGLYRFDIPILPTISISAWVIPFLLMYFLPLYCHRSNLATLLE